MVPPRTQLLHEFVSSANFQINRTSAISGGFDPASDDYVHKLWQWRQSCPKRDDVGHGAFCARCDAPWEYSTDGGVLWLGRTDWVSDPERAGSDSVAKGSRLLDRLSDSGSVLTPSGKRGKVPEGPTDRGVTPDEITILPDTWGNHSPLKLSQHRMEPFWNKTRTEIAVTENCELT